ncbi:MAG: hypothetical protein KGL74_14755, partial [Elusimicrobia bacterium]|nr:hypothetical protein [Elusimicrobiota bacterium]
DDEIEIFPPAAARVRTPPPVRVARAEPEPVKAPAHVPAAPRKRNWPVWAAAAALAVTALAVWGYRRAPDDVRLPLDGADAMTFRPETGDILVAQGTELQTLSRAGRVLARDTLSAPVVSLAWNRGSLWSADGKTPQVTERRDGGKTTVYRLNHVPAALYAEGNNVWTVEKNGRALHQYLISRSILGAMLQPLDLFELPEITPDAFAFDSSGTLWVADDESRSLVRMRAEKGIYKATQRAPLSPLLGPAGEFRGLASDGDAVWILSRPEGGGAALLSRVRAGALDWVAP